MIYEIYVLSVRRRIVKREVTMFVTGVTNYIRSQSMQMFGFVMESSVGTSGALIKKLIKTLLFGDVNTTNV